MQQQPLEYERPTRHRRRRFWRALHLASAVALVVCVAAVIAQSAALGTPVAWVTSDAGRRTYYGFACGRFNVWYVDIVLMTGWLPALWLILLAFKLATRPSKGRTAPTAA